MPTSTSDSLVSVIVPVHNGERYIGEAIESALAQTYRGIEVIVADDGSTDGTARVVAQFPSVKYCLQPRGGTAAARNRGVELSHGSFLAFLDADDLWVEDKLARQIEAFRTCDNVDMVFGHVKQFLSPELDESSKGKLFCPAEPMPGCSPSAMLVTREAFTRVGPFDAGLQAIEWPDWYARAMEKGLKSTMLKPVVVLRRIHKNNKGIVQRALIREYVHVLKASLDRRRGKDSSDVAGTQPD